MSIFSAKKTNRHHPHDDKERYYLLPGQGGSGYRRKQRYILKSSILVGIIVSVILAAIMFLVYRSPR